MSDEAAHGDAVQGGAVDSDGPAVMRMRRHERDHDVPWALPIVVRRSKADIARHVDVLETVAEAVATFLDDPRSQPGGSWHDDVEYWRDGAIRKVVRRGDGKQFEDAAALECVHVEHPGHDGFGDADVLVFPPGPVQPLPRELKKLQVGGTEFPLSADGGDGESFTVDPVVRIELSPHVALSTGKAAAQCGHAAQLAYEQMPQEKRDAWREDGFRVRVDTAAKDAWDEGAAPVQIIDAGFTEVDGPTETVRARW